jgi:Putative papain-like cysteine peptidase (DUF1796)
MNMSEIEAALDTLAASHTDFRAFFDARSRTADEPEDGFRRPDKFGAHYTSYFVSPRVAISAADLDDLRSKIASLTAEQRIEAVRPMLDYLFRVVVARHRNIPRDDVLDAINLVSVGCDCLPRNLLSKWGFKRPRRLGEKSMPFDLAVHPLPAVIALLGSGLADYTEGAFARFDEKLNYPIHARHGIHWNHETGRAWAENDFANLKNLYERRIRNFSESLNDGKTTVLFLRSTDRITDTKIEALVAALTALQAGAANRLVTFAVFTGTVDPALGLTETPREQPTGRGSVHLCHIPTPDAKFVWWMPESYATEAGLNFELAIMTQLRSLIATLIPSAPPLIL